MPGFTGDGHQIRQDALVTIHKAGLRMEVALEDTYSPPEQRRDLAAEQTAIVRRAAEDSMTAIEAWAAARIAEEQRVIDDDSVGTSAEEVRRQANAQRVDAIVAKGGNRETAISLLQRSSDALNRGRIDEAEVLATAADQLLPGVAFPDGDGFTTAEKLLTSIRWERVMADPGKAEALNRINKARATVAFARRDIGAAYSMALRNSAKLASAAGDPDAASHTGSEAASASIASKMSAAVASIDPATNRLKGYQEPYGTNPGGPLNLRGEPIEAAR
jgi:hypothetical protein